MLRRGTGRGAPQGNLILSLVRIPCANIIFLNDVIEPPSSLRFSLVFLSRRRGAEAKESDERNENSIGESKKTYTVKTSFL